jgi:hypothetical protein
MASLTSLILVKFRLLYPPCLLKILGCKVTYCKSDLLVLPSHQRAQTLKPVHSTVQMESEG